MQSLEIEDDISKSVEERRSFEVALQVEEVMERLV